jgi:phosphohistidine phosphatase
VEETRRAARGVHRISADVTRIVSSPATRAHQTAEIARSALGLTRPVELWDELSPDSAAAPVLSRLGDEAKRGDLPMLVGHEPTLGEFVGYALTGEEISLVRLGRAGAVRVCFDAAVTPGGGRVEWMLGRRDLARVRS